MGANVETATAIPRKRDLKQRIEATFRRDKFVACVFVVVLWLTILFVMFSVRPYITDARVEVVCWCGAAVLLLFNTSSILAMIRHYGQDKAHIYAVDIRHLDAGR